MTGEREEGTIERWGDKGYGFIKRSDGSSAWVHAKMLRDPTYQPMVGDRVSFVATLNTEYNRYTAHDVVLVQGRERGPSSFNTPRGSEGLWAMRSRMAL